MGCKLGYQCACRCPRTKQCWPSTGTIHTKLTKLFRNFLSCQILTSERRVNWSRNLFQNSRRDPANTPGTLSACTCSIRDIVQSGAVITWHNIARYFLQHFSYWGITLIRIRVHKISLITSELMDVSFGDLREYWPRYSDMALYIVLNNNS